MDNVALIGCPSYEERAVRRCVEEAVEAAGGLSSVIRPGSAVLLKVNLLRAAPPEEAITTHPAVVAAVAGMVRDLGGRAIIADSPGSGYRYNQRVMDGVYLKCGMKEAAQKTDAELNRDMGVKSVSHPTGMLIKHLDVIRPVLEADVIINIPKAKTHSYMYFTGAVKNLFGIIPGLAKPGYHSKLNDTERFARMLVDLVALTPPAINIMDAVVGMEGDGPSSGSPRSMGLIMASTSAAALDVGLCRVMGRDPLAFPTVRATMERGWLPPGPDGIKWKGMDPQEVVVKDFQMPATMLSEDGFSRLSILHRMTRPFFRSMFTVRPAVIEERCIGCGACQRSCPVEAVKVDGRSIARIDDRLCIRCYCCHEMCPERAIELKRSLLNRIFLK
ncbi:MAG: DUF362 domain-containing protein [Deltaproteobacteria bacterium]|nr:DUF362 domain-containing protein [Deltaproteobacteria bacterium]MBW2309034.1 DUF362 domain-containing protein [Deltaproteobacteria bacterium]